MRRLRKPAGASAAADDGHSELGGRQDSDEPAARRWFRWRGVQPGDHGSVQYPRERHHDSGQGKEPDEFRGRAESAYDEWRPNSDVRQQDEPHPDDEHRARAGAAAITRRWPRGPGRGHTWFVYDSRDRQVTAVDRLAEAAAQTQRRSPDE